MHTFVQCLRLLKGGEYFTVGHRAFSGGLGLCHDLFVARQLTSYFESIRLNLTEGGGEGVFNRDTRNDKGMEEVVLRTLRGTGVPRRRASDLD